MQALGEAGVRGFSRPGVESSSLYDNTVGAVFPQPAEFFYMLHIVFQSYFPEEKDNNIKTSCSSSLLFPLKRIRPYLFEYSNCNSAFADVIEVCTFLNFLH